MTDVKIPLPTTIQSFDGLAKRTESLTNLFAVKSKDDETFLVPTPGVGQSAHLADVSGSIARSGGRAVFEFQDRDYFLTETALFLVSLGGLPDTFGVSVVDPVNFDGTIEKTDYAISHTHVVMVGFDNRIYHYDGTTLVEIITGSGNYSASVEVAYINGRFVFVPSDGSPAYYTDVNTMTVGVSNFFDAQLLPDLNTGVINLNNDLYLMGAGSIEVFRDTGSASSPFRRIDGASVETGYICGKIHYKDSFLFVGRERGQGVGVFLMGSGVAHRVSTPAVDALLQTYNIDNLGTSSTRNLILTTTSRYSHNGYDLVFFNLESHTLVFHEGQWSFIKSHNSDTWNTRYILTSKRKNNALTLTDDGQGGLLGNHDIEVDDSVSYPINRVIQSYARHDNEGVFTVNNLRLSVSDDHNTVKQPIGLSVSHNGIDFGPEMKRDPAVTDQIHFTGRGGLGRYEGYMGYKISTLGQYKFAVDSATLDING